MAFDVVVTANAKNDLEEIWHYIAAHAGSVRADHVLDALESKIALLVTSPTLGNLPKELGSLGVTEFRELHWKPYRIIFSATGRTILVHCVLDGRRDMAALLQERLLR